MVIAIRIRTPGLPSDLPDSGIGGFFDLLNISGIGEVDAKNVSNGEIFSIANSSPRAWYYVVNWSWVFELTSPIPSSISTFAGNPERRYMGVFTFRQANNVSDNVQLNYQNQQGYGGCYDYGFGGRSRLGLGDWEGGTGGIFSFVGRPTPDTASGNFGSGGGNFIRVADTLSWLLFPGIQGNLRISYFAALQAAITAPNTLVKSPL